MAASDRAGLPPSGVPYAAVADAQIVGVFPLSLRTFEILRAGACVDAVCQLRRHFGDSVETEQTLWNAAIRTGGDAVAAQSRRGT